ncbi:MAG TPA: OmpH family outer membrane protein [Desulfomonilaceae bacterium]|nr:OmpH family outer membrane protein [Desulfomonilaceae bacterium]
MNYCHCLKIATCLALCFTLTIVLTVPSSAADLKLAKVNLEAVYGNSARVKAALDDMRKMQTESNARLAGMREQMTKIEEQLKDEKSPLKKEEREKLENELKGKVQALENEQQSLQAKLTFKQRSIQNIFGTQIKSAVEKVAKEEGLAAVLTQQALIYAGDLPDLTEKVTKELDAMPALEKQ